ncbi:MAG: hypothetical protein ACE5D2_02315 [Fidelibacterota bacterium]
MNNPRSHKRTFKKRFYSVFSVMLVILLIACDFQNPANFDLPTWFFDLEFPLVQKKYSLKGLIDNKQIFSTDDSLGMQIVFEGSLPDTALNTDILTVELNQDLNFNQDPITSPSLSFSLDTTINMSVPIVPGGQLNNSSGTAFSIPPSQDQTVSQSDWNSIASAFDTTIQITIDLPQISASQLPDFVTSIEALIIQDDTGNETSDFTSTLTNNGVPTDITNVQFSLLTDVTSPPRTLADHSQSTVAKDQAFGPQTTSLSGDSLGNAIRMDIGFGVASTSGSVTINSSDSVQVNIAIRLRIAGVDTAVAKITDYTIPVDLPSVAFPSDIEIYQGQLNTGTGFGTNEITISNLRSSYPMDVGFSLSFQNFKPPAGSDSVKIDTTLQKGKAAISKTFDVDGYTFANPAGSDSALSKMSIGIQGTIAAQTTKLPLDGSDFGALSVRIQVEKLSFQSLDANIVQNFPPTEFNIAGMPYGFSGMSFSDVKMEIEMLNGIRLPVYLDFDLVAQNQAGDSILVAARATLASPTTSGDTAKTIIRLSRDGTTTLKYKAPASIFYTDSATVSPSSGESTIVDLMSFNPASIRVLSKARIDGRGTLESGVSIGGSYRMIAPFEVIMEPMTFISATNTPIAEMDYKMRNRIRSTLQSANMTTEVENKIPSGGELAILMSNRTFFPLDTTQAALSMYRDSMVVQNGWSATDSLYIITNCDSLNPDLTTVFIFDVMDDYADCINGLAYLVKYSGGPLDTVISYVDTLIKITLPDPTSFYSSSGTGHRPGMVKDPGFASYSSIVSPQRLRLITDRGDHYTAPRFHLNGSDGSPVFLSVSDYIDINSTLTMKLSSTGMIKSPPDEIIVIYPNGGETINKNESVTLKWRTFGTVGKVDIAYSAGTDPSVKKDGDWTTIVSNETNVDSFNWTPKSTQGINSMSSSLRDSIRIRVKDSNSLTADMSGWYFTISSSSSRLNPSIDLLSVNRLVR